MSYAKVWIPAWEVLRWPFVRFRHSRRSSNKAVAAGQEIAFVFGAIPIALACTVGGLAWAAVLVVLTVYGIVGSAVVAVSRIGGRR
jgi:hypothetical protein